MQSDIGSENISRRIIQFCAGFAVGAGILSLTGWISGLRLLASIRSGYVPMAPNTSIAFITLGGTLFIFAQWPSHRITLRLCKIVAILDLLMGFLTFVQYFSDINLGINPLLFKTSETLNNFPLAVMSPITAGNFFLAGISLLILSFFPADQRHIKDAASCLASVIVIVGLVVTLGYLYRTPLLYGGTTVPMAITTALAFIALGIGIIATAGSRYWPQCLFTGQTTRSRLIRVFLPVTLAFFILNSWLNTNIILGSKTNPALVLIFQLILFVIIICDIISRISGKIGGAIDRAYAEREKIEKQLRVEIAEHKRSEQETNLLQTITTAISESENFQAALSVVLRKVCKTTGWVYGEAWLLSSDHKSLECAVSWYEPSEKLEEFVKKSKEFKFPPGICLSGSVWSSKKPEWMRDVTTAGGNFPRAALARKFNLKSAMGIPVVANNEVVAVLCFFVKELREEDKHLLRLLFSVAMQLGTVIQRKRAEEEKEKLREQLYHTQKIESLGTLTSGIAHDFNNILMAITGYGTLIHKEIKEGSPLRDFAQKILKSAERAAILTGGLLAFGRKQPNNPEPINLNEIVKMSESILARVIREDIKFRTVLTDKNCVVMADSNQIEQVLVNLATNARDAMPNGGSLTISTDIIEMDDAFIKAHGYGVKGMYALISVSDTGIGMDEITKQRIFEPFFTTKEVGKGTGLGLAIVYGIVKQHNGYVNVYSEPGKGTTFRIYLPLITRKQD